MSQTEEAIESGAKRTGLPEYVVVMLGIAATVAALVLMREFSGVVGPVFLALNLIIAAYPIHRWLVGKGTPAWLAAAVMALTVVVLLLLAVWSMAWTVNALVNELTKPRYTAQYQTIYHGITTFLAGFNINLDNVGLNEVVTTINPSTITGAITTILSQTSSILGVVAVIVLTMVFLAMDGPSIDSRLRIVGLVNTRVGRAIGDFTRGVRRYWVVTTVFGLIVAVLDGVALVIMHVPLALAWAVLSFLTNYIPNVGFFIGLVPPALLALFTGGWQLALAVVIVYAVLNVIIQSVIQPRFTGESVGVSVTVSFLSLLLWGFVLGPLGTLLALPMTLLAKALLVDADPKARWVAALISSRPAEVLEPEASDG
ncbi:MAG: AI-2E family transporter [Actinomycetia bacterium]|nr:AI-2E family transporter [Actinomycetes bacterium]